MKTKKIWGLITAVLFAVCLSVVLTACSCGITGEFVLDKYSVDYSNGKVVFEWEGNGSFEVYKSSSPNGAKTLVEKVNGKKTYSVADKDNYYSFKATDGDESTAPFSYVHSSLGDGVKVFTPKDNQGDIQEHISKLYERMAWDEFGSSRHALMFMPGDYSDVTVHVGYYTSVAGLGYDPTAVSVGKLDIRQHPFTGSMLTNFWRTVENFTALSDSSFCVSQATSMRRLNVEGDLLLSTGGWGSGGFISDSAVSGTIRANDGTGADRQQQWFTRNTSFKSFLGGQMNMVFVGTNGTLPNLSPAARVTNVAQTEFVREKPFVVFDNQKGYGVYLPNYRTQAVGNTWDDEMVGGQFIPLNKFYIASAAKDTAESINAALAGGKHLLLSPGIYYLDEPIKVTKKNTIVTGIGLATLAVTDKNTEAALTTADEGGINISSLLFEAGVHSENLVRIGGDKTSVSHSDNPICIADLFFRSGGTYKHNVWVDQTIVINSNDVFGDNFWMWRADHSFTGNLYEETMRFYKNAQGNWVLDGLKAADGTGKQVDNWKWDGGFVGWSQSYGRNGVVINGDKVTMYGLMVEHYQEYQTIWNGEDGFMCFYQSETPYDAPTQADWCRNNNPNGIDRGWASYKIGDNVQRHTALGVGIYFVNNYTEGATHTKYMDHAIEVPRNPGITVKNMVTAHFKGLGGIANHINDGTGYGANCVNGAKQYLISYIGGVV